MTAIFHELIKDSMEVFMDDFSVFGSSFDHCLKNLEKMLKRCEETNLALNWENATSCDYAVGAEFDIEIRNKKGAENLAADHLSRLENPDLGKLTRAEIRDLFLEEQLMAISDKNNEPCVLTESYEDAWPEKRHHKLIDNVTADHPEDIMTSPPPQEKSSRLEAQAFPTNDARNEVNFLKRLFARFGIPKALISDRGTHFCNHQIKKAMKRCGVVHRFSTAYHPQTNGQVENTNRAIKRILEKTIGNNKKDWSYIMGCPECIMGIPDSINELDEMRLDAYESSISYKERTKRWNDKRIKLPINYERGDKVLLFNSRLRLFLGKLKSRWYRPFSVSKDMKNRAIELYDEEGSEFIVNQVKPYQKNILDTNRDDDITLDDQGEVIVTINTRCRHNDFPIYTNPLMKNHPLDQTGGPREEGREKNQSQPMHQRKRHPRQLATKSHHKFDDESAQAEELMQTAKDLEESVHQEFETGVTKDQPDEETSQLPDCSLAQMEDPRESFNELMDTPLDFSTFVMNRLKVDTLTPELLTGPTFELMKGSCKSLVELEYFLEEVYKETTDQLDWINPKGQQYPHDLRKPLPLIPNFRGRQVIPFDHFINNDLEYLSGGVSSRKYTTSVTKTKAADYRHIKWIEDLVPNRMESTCDVYSKRKIIAATKIEIVEWHNYKHLAWINVRRDDDKLHKFKDDDFKRLHIQDIEDMLLLLVQGVKSYQKKLNLIKPDTYRSDLKRREAYSAYSNTRGFIYQNKYKKNRLMRIDKLHKFSDGTLNDVRTALNDRLKGIRMKYLPQTIWRQSDRDKEAAMIQEIDKQLKTRRIMWSLEKFVGERPYEGDFRLLQRTI
ncbi:reverse transcriptase domain-containing protein [Tanacetum coccineum]